MVIIALMNGISGSESIFAGFSGGCYFRRGFLHRCSDCWEVFGDSGCGCVGQ